MLILIEFDFLWSMLDEFIFGSYQADVIIVIHKAKVRFYWIF
jgi:hypothetical protein